MSDKKPTEKKSEELKPESGDELELLRAQLEEAKELRKKYEEVLTKLSDKDAHEEAAKTSSEVNPATQAKPPDDPMEDYVTVTLFKGEKEMAEDVFVSINGETCLIQRGKPVKIRRKFANLLRQNRRQDLLAMETIQRLSE